MVGNAHPTLNNIVGLIYQLSTINYQLSTINYQLSTINCQLSTINYQRVRSKVIADVAVTPVLGKSGVPPIPP